MRFPLLELSFWAPLPFSSVSSVVDDRGPRPYSHPMTSENKCLSVVVKQGKANVCTLKRAQVLLELDAGGLPSRLGEAHGEDDITCLPLRFDVPGRLDYVLHWVVPVDNRPVLTRLDELLEQEDVLLRVAWW